MSHIKLEDLLGHAFEGDDLDECLATFRATAALDDDAIEQIGRRVCLLGDDEAFSYVEQLLDSLALRAEYIDVLETAAGLIRAGAYFVETLEVSEQPRPKRNGRENGTPGKVDEINEFLFGAEVVHG